MEKSANRLSFCDVGSLIINQLLKVCGSVGLITRLMKSVSLAGWVNFYFSQSLFSSSIFKKIMMIMPTSWSHKMILYVKRDTVSASEFD